MSEMIERVARAMCDPDGYLTPAEQMDHWRVKARVAIEAMRYLDLDMQEAGDRAYREARVSGVSGMTIDAQIRSQTARFGAGWGAAIDAALNGEAA